MSLKHRQHFKPYSQIYKSTAPEDIEEATRSFRAYAPYIQTGDAILYQSHDDDNTGLVKKIAHLATAKVSGSLYSHAGMAYVTSDPADPTKKRYFVIEATRNQECVTDQIAQSPNRKGGIWCFDLLERLQSFPGTAVWVPLNIQFSQSSSVLLDKFLARQWLRSPSFDVKGMVACGLVQALNLESHAGDAHRNDWSSFFCSEFVSACLRVARVSDLQGEETSLLTPGDIARLPCYDHPYVIKTHVSQRELYKALLEVIFAAPNRKQQLRDARELLLFGVEVQDTEDIAQFKEELFRIRALQAKHSIVQQDLSKMIEQRKACEMESERLDARLIHLLREMGEDSEDVVAIRQEMKSNVSTLDEIAEKLRAKLQAEASLIQLIAADKEALLVEIDRREDALRESKLAHT